MVGAGPSGFSTCSALVRRGLVVTDANGYYAALGVSPSASRGEIGRAYRRLRGWESHRLTYIVSQLLDPEVRASYDATPVGEPFWDRYVSYAASVVVGERARRSGVNLVALVTPRAEAEVGWSHFVVGDASLDAEVMDRWRGALVRASQTVRELAVGVAPEWCLSHPWGMAIVGGQIVAFIGEGVDPDDTAAHAAMSLVEDGSLSDPTTDTEEVFIYVRREA